MRANLAKNFSKFFENFAKNRFSEKLMGSPKPIEANFFHVPKPPGGENPQRAPYNISDSYYNQSLL